jgi:large subunit ribosomal protein L7e
LCIEKLKPYDSYLAYGYISNKTVVELVHRRAYIKDGTARNALSDNLTVENNLSHLGLLCLSDLSHEIFSVGTHFDEATKLLATFKLSAPVGSYEKKVLKKFDEVEGHGGFLGEEMDAFVNKIL